ncbi:MAG: hypothetical protein GY953_42895, partial [bacterium]|nr:hypothetical protein [bacterium]
MLWQTFSNESYRLIGRVAAKVLGTFDFVETVYARRSVAAGEVAFGRSDIDLQIVISKPMVTAAEAQRILRLSRCFRTLRTCCPVIGETFVVTQSEQDRMYSLDPYRASLDRRCALVLHGKPVRIPAPPIEPEDAVLRAIFWFRSYLPYGVRKRNRRNLHKFALEIWNAYATATRLITEPFTTREATGEAWQRLEPETYPGFAGKGPADYLRECFVLAERLHRVLRPPLPRLNKPLRLNTQRYQVFVVPTPDASAPAGSWPWDTVIATPEVLDLFVHYVAPRFYLELASELEALG